jgi:P63C domain
MEQPKQIVQATHGSIDRPLRIGNIEIPCYVLEDGRRVLVQQGLLKALDMSPGGSGVSRRTQSGTRLSKFIAGKSLQPFVNDSLVEAISNPIIFRTTKGSNAYGFEATVLADICDAILEARKERRLDRQQEHIAEQCEILVRGFARVGIIALVDEATGYQEVRARNALEEILEKFVTKELSKWAKTFPDEFYQELFRLRGWQYMPFSVKRPILIGNLTINLVYDRLAPGVVDELKRLNPKDSKGRRKHKMFQNLTEDIGHPRLREHLSAVIALMKASTSWDNFYRMIERALPRYNTTLTIPWDDHMKDDTV